MYSRRSMLAACGTVVGTTALSGCSSLLSSGDGDESRTYEEWIPDEGGSRLAFSAARRSEAVSIDGVPDGVMGEPRYGLANEDVALEVYNGSSRVLRGSFDSGTVREAIEEDRGLNLEADGSLNGYELYVATGDSEPTVGNNGDVTVIGNNDALERMIDASLGDADRSVDVNDDFALLVDLLGTGHSVSGTVGLREQTNDGPASQSRVGEDS